MSRSNQDALPDVLDEATARAFCGACWDDADWETLSAATPGTVSKNVFKAAVQVRNHAPSLRTWLEFWRIDELTHDLEELQVGARDRARGAGACFLSRAGAAENSRATLLTCGRVRNRLLVWAWVQCNRV